MREEQEMLEEARATAVAEEIEAGELEPLGVWTLIDIEDVTTGEALVGELRRVKRDEVRQTVAGEVAAEQPKTRAAGQGALFETAPDGFDPK